MSKTGKSSIGVSAAPTPVNTSSLRNEKGKDSNGNIIGTNVWGHSSGSAELSEPNTNDFEKSQTRPAPWTVKSVQPETNESNGLQTTNTTTATTTTASQIVIESKRRSWADSDDEDDDPPEKPTPTATYAIASHPPNAMTQTSNNSHNNTTTNHHPPPVPHTQHHTNAHPHTHTQMNSNHHSHAHTNTHSHSAPNYHVEEPQRHIASQDVRYSNDNRSDYRPHNQNSQYPPRENHSLNWQQQQQQQQLSHDYPKMSQRFEQNSVRIIIITSFLISN